EHMANMTASGSTTISYNELLERGRSFVITAKKEIKDMGKTRTKIEAMLLSKGSEVERNLGVYEKDFKNKETEAKDWSEKNFENWNRYVAQIGVKEFFTELEDSKSISSKMNKAIQNSGGDLNRLHEGLEKDVFIGTKESIDKALMHPDAKIKQDIHVYVDLYPEDFGISSSEMFDPNNLAKINPDSIQKLKKNDYGKFSNFTLLQLHEKSKKETDGNRIRVHMILPVGTSLGHIADDRFVLPSEKGFRVKEVSIFEEDLVQNVRLELEYKDKTDDITQQIREKEKVINDTWASGLQLGIENKMIQLDINDKYASGTVQHVEEAIHETVRTVNTELLSEIMKFMLERFDPNGPKEAITPIIPSPIGGRIIFTDRDLEYMKPLFGEEGRGAEGSTNRTWRTIVVNGYVKDLSFRDTETIKDTLVHELGHALDLLINNIRLGTDGELFFEKSDQFNKLFTEEIEKNLKEPYFNYTRDNSTEAFAEIFNFMHSNTVYTDGTGSDIDGKKLSDVMNIRVPQTVEYIKTVILNNFGIEI
ncbi:TPA: hypothetical protein ROY17_005687, partial [Bacillus thuringiensis]|nr:hypothetical protein [Bacillus thuringiensis]